MQEIYVSEAEFYCYASRRVGWSVQETEPSKTHSAQNSLFREIEEPRALYVSEEYEPRVEL